MCGGYKLGVLITHAYNHELVALSILIATMGAYVALNIVLRIKESLEKTNPLWLLGGAVAMGLGIWSMHFVGMLAMKMPGMVVGYDLFLSVLSLIVAIGASLVAFYLVSRVKVSLTTMILGGVSMAVAISGMHYIGMASMEMPARIQWRWDLVALSVFIAAFASFAALGVSILFRTTKRITLLHIFSSLLMGIAVSGMHYTGMTAANFIYDDSVLQSHQGVVLGTQTVAYVVVGATLVILLVALIASGFARILIRRAKESKEAIHSRDVLLKQAQSIAHLGSWEAMIDGSIVSMSDEMYNIYNIEKNSKITGEDLVSFAAPEDRDKIRQAISDAVAHKKNFNFDHIVRLADGTSKYVQTRGHVSLDEKGEVVKIVGATQDITDRKRIEQELLQTQAELESRVQQRTADLEQALKGEKKAKEEAEAATKAKMTFLANMSHEIRTPMNAILGFADLLSSEKLSDEQDEFLGRIHANGTLLLRIIDDILDLSKFEAGKMPIEKSAVSYLSLVEEVTSSLSLMAQQKGIAIQVEKQNEMPSTIYSDPVRVRQILVNLIGNSVKFSEKGPIKVRLKSERIDGKTHILTEVQDFGIGISEEGQRQIFQAFGQADNSIIRKFGGTGLGLVLSRHFARALGGNLSLLESKEGVGSTFLFTIVSDSEEQIKDIAVNQPNDPKAPVTLQDFADQTVNVLLAEDTTDNQILIRRYLKSNNFKVTCANDGFEALQLASNNDFDLILMDIQMPGMDGLQATRELRSRGYKKPIIALTAHALREEIEKSLDAGCNAHLTKPINRSDLLRAIKETLT
ncbi:response regulator [Bdellovibrio sp. SKB1291214]|uniref:MHYT domain-containing protein n=1 Tax=Bdellovibrio sp. SKB1291214 TaxID=1732569 RepID=UPI000B51C0B7|nr:MHYT domain-containing protein [Bdellovibrio sp. SKB1291214]UYL09784.1 response regulator [Bdellovibrio sp. SKB1291214]